MISANFGYDIKVVNEDVNLLRSFLIRHVLAIIRIQNRYDTSTNTALFRVCERECEPIPGYHNKIPSFRTYHRAMYLQENYRSRSFVFSNLPAFGSTLRPSASSVSTPIKTRSIFGLINTGFTVSSF